MLLICSAVLSATALATPPDPTRCPTERVAGTAGPDELEGDDRAQTMSGEEGDDHLIAHDGGDCLFGGTGGDFLEGDRGDDLLVGGPGADHLEGGWGRDRLDGGTGDDRIGGGQEASVIDAGPGNDAVSSSNGVRDSVSCGPGRDRVRADRGDRLSGCESVRYVVSPYGVVSPSTGGTTTTFTLTFRALYAATGDVRKSAYVIGVVSGCGQSFGRVIERPVRVGEIVRVRLSPATFRYRAWCRGLFRGVLHYEADAPPPGARDKDIRLGRWFYRVR